MGIKEILRIAPNVLNALWRLSKAICRISNSKECDKCHGKGAMPDFHTCDKCNGTGKVEDKS